MTARRICILMLGYKELNPKYHELPIKNESHKELPLVLRAKHNNHQQGCTQDFQVMLGKISAQPHPTLCIQFLDGENNDKTIHCHWENRSVLQQYGAVRKFYLMLSYVLTVHWPQWDIVKFSQHSPGVGSLKTHSCTRTHYLSLLEV